MGMRVTVDVAYSPIWDNYRNVAAKKSNDSGLRDNLARVGAVGLRGISAILVLILKYPLAVEVGRKVLCSRLVVQFRASSNLRAHENSAVAVAYHLCDGGLASSGFYAVEIQRTDSVGFEQISYESLDVHNVLIVSANIIFFNIKTIQ